METALRQPNYGRLITSVGKRIAVRCQLLERNLTRYVALAAEISRLNVPDLLIARDTIPGAILRNRIYAIRAYPCKSFARPGF